jgi:hypothetical protein
MLNAEAMAHQTRLRARRIGLLEWTHCRVNKFLQNF